MDVQEFAVEKSMHEKLPTKADWWRDAEKSKGITKDANVEHFKTPPLEMKLPETIDKPFERNSTIDTVGPIEISSILYPVHLETDREIYEQNCEFFQCPSSRKFGKTLDNISTGFYPEDVNMANYGLTATGIMATSISLLNLSHCSSIDLQGNTLSSASLNTLVAVLKKTQVSEMNLSATKISKFGPPILAKWISSTLTMKRLFLRDNQLDDLDGVTLFESLSGNRSIIHLDVSENHFCIRCADALKKLFDENDVLEAVDLSWNHLRLNATMAIAKGLLRNNGMKVLNLSWNGIEDMTAKEFGLALKDNESLRTLILEANRITDAGFLMLMKGVEKNSSLKVLRIGRNNISQKAAETILDSLKNGELRNCSMEILDFTNNIFKQNFHASIDDVKKVRGDFSCLFGYAETHRERKRKEKDSSEDICQLLKSSLKGTNSDLIKLFQRFNRDSRTFVTFDEFRQVLKDANIPMNFEEVDQLIRYLDPENSGEINLRKLMKIFEEMQTNE